MHLKDLGDGRFKGTCIDLEGAEEGDEPTTIEGFMEGSFISFTKEYTHLFWVEEDGTKTK